MDNCPVVSVADENSLANFRGIIVYPIIFATIIRINPMQSRQ